MISNDELNTRVAALELFFRDGHTHKSVAESIGQTTGNVKSWISQVRNVKQGDTGWPSAAARLLTARGVDVHRYRMTPRRLNFESKKVQPENLQDQEQRKSLGLSDPRFDYLVGTQAKQKEVAERIKSFSSNETSEAYSSALKEQIKKLQEENAFLRRKIGALTKAFSDI